MKVNKKRQTIEMHFRYNKIYRKMRALFTVYEHTQDGERFVCFRKIIRRFFRERDKSTDVEVRAARSSQAHAPISQGYIKVYAGNIRSHKVRSIAIVGCYGYGCNLLFGVIRCVWSVGCKFQGDFYMKYYLPKDLKRYLFVCDREMDMTTYSGCKRRCHKEDFRLRWEQHLRKDLHRDCAIENETKARRFVTCSSQTHTYGQMRIRKSKNPFIHLCFLSLSLVYLLIPLLFRSGCRLWRRSDRRDSECGSRRA